MQRLDVGCLVPEPLGDDVALLGDELVERGRALRLRRPRVPVRSRAHESALGAGAGDVEQPPLLGLLAVANDRVEVGLLADDPRGRNALVLPAGEPPRQRRRVAHRVLAAPVVGEDPRRSLGPGQTGDEHDGKLEALGLVDRHHLDRVAIARMGLGHILLGLVQQVQVLEEGRQAGITLDRREPLGQIEEAQQVLPPALPRGPPQPGAVDDRLGQVEDGQPERGSGQLAPLGPEPLQPGTGRGREVGHVVEPGQPVGQDAAVVALGQRRRETGDRGEVSEADAIARAAQHPQQRDRRGRVGDHLEPRDHVDDLGPVEEPARADDLHRHAALRQRVRDDRDQLPLAAQHRVRRPARSGRHDVVGDGGRLLHVVGREEALDDGGRRSRLGHQLLLQRTFDVALDPVGKLDELGAEPERRLQRSLLHWREVLGEALDVVEVRAAERVDGLHVVADRGDG